MPTTTLASRIWRFIARSGRERGDGPASAAILAPVVLLLAFAVIGRGYYNSARDALTTAALIATQTASAQGASQADGRAAAEAYLAKTLPPGMSGVTISISEGEIVTATVSGSYQAPMGLTFPAMESHSSSAKERVSEP